MTNLTIDIRGLSAAVTIKITNGTVTNLTIYDGAATLDLNDATLPNGATVK